MSFSEADFNTIILTPANFIQWQGPLENYPGENYSPVDATVNIFEWCDNQEANMNFYIYENWPDMAPYLSDGFPPSNQEINTYNNYVLDEFHEWFLDYYNEVTDRVDLPCLKMIPAGPVISHLFQNGFLDNIPITELYEDDAPHGRASIYFLASLVTYMTIYEEIAPLDYVPNDFIHENIRDSYQDIVNEIWSILPTFVNEEGSTVFCSLTTSTSALQVNSEIRIRPNPTSNFFEIETGLVEFDVSVINLTGQILKQKTFTTSDIFSMDIEDLPPGLYFIRITDFKNRVHKIESLVIE